MIRMVVAIRESIKRVVDCNKGVAFVEFALCLPFLLLLFWGTVEVTRYFLAIQKMEKTLDMVADTVAQADQSSETENLTTDNIHNLFSVVPEMMSPYDFATNGIIIITDIKQPADTSLPPVINWQACGGGSLARTSAIGTASTTSTPNTAVTPLPSGLVLNANEEVLVGEIYYDFSPLTVQDMLGTVSMSRIVYFVPRLGSLATALSSTCP